MIKILLVATVGIGLALATLQPAGASAPGGKTVCVNGVCYVQVTNPGGGGSGGSGSGGGSGGCQWLHKAVPCSVDGSTFNSVSGCYFKEANPYPTTGPVADEYAKGGGGIYWATCPFGGSGGYVWLPQPPAGMGPTPAQLAQQAFDSLTLPKPSAGRYPAGKLQDGQPYTVVHAYTWYYTDPTDFTKLSARAAAGPVWAQVTVTPAALTFKPGDGNATVSCAGPGTAWDSSYGVWAASPSGCDYQYPHSSIHDSKQQVTATYGITWHVTWTGSGNTNGTLPDQTTTSNASFAVAEVESVVTH